MAVSHWPQAAIPGQAWGAAIALGVACTGLAFLNLSSFDGRIGPVACVDHDLYRSALSALRSHQLFLGEPVTLQMLIAGAFILGSVAVSRKG